MEIKMAVLEVKNLSFKYSGADENAISDLSFSVERGETVLLCGPTGCGKSTLIANLVPGISLRGERRGEVIYRGGKVGYVGQSSSVFITDRVRTELAFASENEGRSPELTRRRVCELAAVLGIEELLERKTDSLSGGEARLVSLGAALINSPELLVLDEPASNLDPVTSSRFYDCLFRLAREIGLSLIVSEHRTDEIADRADRMIVMEKGQIVVNASPDKLSSLAESQALRGFLPISARVAVGFGKKEELPLNIAQGRRFLSSVLGDRGRSGREKSAEETAVSGETVLSMKDIYFAYSKNSPDILRGFDLSLKRGEALCLLGGNGSGKSTALAVAAGLRKNYSGKIRILGKKLSDYKGNSLYEGGVALLPQDVRSLFTRETVKEELQGCSTLLPFDISHLYDRHPYDLSGGEAHLVGLAIALSAKPSILMLDEPTQGVDPAAKRLIGELLRKLKGEELSIICVTHDADLAPLFADRCLLVSQGRALGGGSPREFFLGGEYYTTSARRLARGLVEDAVTEEEIFGD